ncbi:hypothetical protein K6959_15965 [Bacillus aquiflavi]|uniref:hypothetical protein n=1 Tax=Bacillus aquiflavi TaxID=2672567 RepID=UPI001CA9A68E|nr:hypothetical protein [Bacillus aquiflavi]UAC48058.1 hypothetical protein K6959_15965 [Bacillus aquiflavi]
MTSKQTVNGRTSNYNMANTFEYVQYNKVKIEKPKVDDEKKEEVTWSKEEKELYEQEAANYLDALIQATVYQNVEGYVEKVPGSQSIEEKQKDGEFQKNLFIGIYIENTKRNIPGADDQQIEALANAFMNALKNTRYKVIGAKADKDHFFKVTLEIEGIDQAKLNHEVQMTLMDEMSKGSITQKDLSKRDFELQIEKYNGEIERLKPITISVDVIRNGNGSYMVLMQDQYLLTFVQS